MTELPEVREVEALSEDAEEQCLISLSDLGFVFIVSSNQVMFS